MEKLWNDKLVRSFLCWQILGFRTGFFGSTEFEAIDCILCYLFLVYEIARTKKAYSKRVGFYIGSVIIIQLSITILLMFPYR